jgi:ABC-2 type transport system permease protein
MNIQRILALILKELQEQFSTKRGIFVVVIPVLIQTLIFPFVVTMDVTHCPVSVLNDDAGRHSVELIQRIAAAPYISSLTQVSGLEELKSSLVDQQVMIGLHVPSDFSSKIERGETATIQVLGDGRRSNSSQIATGYINSIVSTMNTEITSSDGVSKQQVLTRHLYNPELEYRWFILPCLFGLLGMITTLNISTMAVAREREDGTYEQLCVTPMSPLEILIGKTVPSTLIVSVQCFLILIMAVWVYQVPLLGSLPALFSSVIMYSLSLTGVGFSISSLCRTQQQAFVGMFCFVVPGLLLSGFVSPVQNMPELLRVCSVADPLYYIFIVLRGIFLKGYTLRDVLPYLGAFATIGSISMLIAYSILRLKRA